MLCEKGGVPLGSDHALTMSLNSIILPCYGTHACVITCGTWLRPRCICLNCFMLPQCSCYAQLCLLTAQLCHCYKVFRHETQPYSGSSIDEL
jgi:hypothetical protein